MLDQSANILVKSIETFIRRYFKNRLFKGLIFFTLLISSVFLAMVFLENLAYLPTYMRAILLYGYCMLFLIVLVRYVGIPVYKLIRYRQSMSYKEAAVYLGRFFPNVSDKLLNTLQLQDLYSIDNETELLVASINQRTLQLSKIPFASAVNLRENIRYLRWASIPLLILMVLFLAAPAFIQQPTERILDYNTVYNKPLPFTVSIKSPLFVTQNSDYELLIELEGDEFPEQFHIETNGMKMPMERIASNAFSLLFKKLSQEMLFQIRGGRYNSGILKLNVFPKAMLMSFEAHLQYPEYMNRENESIRDQNWIGVPQGTLINWRFYTRATDELHVMVDSANQQVDFLEDKWSLKTIVDASFDLELIASNTQSGPSEPMLLHIESIPDEWPSISVQLIEDEYLNSNKYFTGLIDDDYGFSRLERRIEIIDEKGQILKENAEVLQLDPTLLRQQFFYFLTLDSLRIENAKEIVVQFAVYDNDQVRGPKEKLSQSFTLLFTDPSTLDSISKAQEELITKSLEEVKEESALLRHEMREFQRELLQKKELDWNDKQQLEELIHRQQSLENLLESLKEDQKKLNQFNQDHDLVQERLLEKQQQIDKLIEEIIPEDIRQMMEELQKFLEELNKDQVAEMLKNLEMNNEKIEEMLDRNLALLKQLQFEKKMNEWMERLENLSKELIENAENTLEKGRDKDELSEELNRIQEAFEDEISSLDQLKQENELLEKPFNLENTEEEEQEIESKLEQGQESLSRRKNKESHDSQQNAAQGMQQLRDKVQQMMQMSSMQQLAEDAAEVRFLLETILRISFAQEDALMSLHQIRRDDPAYVGIMKDQSMIAEAFLTVEDSLRAISKRQPMIENFVFKEIDEINDHITESQEYMKDRHSSQAAASQQYAMMGMNNLALLLAESLKKMQENMGMPSPMQGEGQCADGQSPGEGIQNLREMQDALGQTLQDLMDGKNSGQNGMGMSEEIARMAAQQEAIRNQMKQLIDGLKAEGELGDKGLSEALKEMEMFEEQLVNKQLNQNLVKRQNEIMVRLLESEKAIKEREKEERRESTEFKGENFGNLIDENEYKRIIERQLDMLRTAPLDLQPYYKRKLSEYFMRFNIQARHEKDQIQ